MATTEGEPKVSVKLMVHKKQNKVIFAEADNDFADLLFSFLTMPLGTIIRLVGEESDDMQPGGPKIGSLTNLYKSVADLDPKFFCTEMCKHMLLYPRNDAAQECRRLKVNIDDTEAPKYFVCDSCYRNSIDKTCSMVSGVLCSFCENYLMTTDITQIDYSRDQWPIFFYKATTLLIGDDFCIRPTSPRNIMEMLKPFGITDVKLLMEKVVHVGKVEILNLLKCSLISKTPFTDAFLKSTAGHQPPQPIHCETISNEFVPPKIDEHDDTAKNSLQQFPLKLQVRKSDNKVLFAEANSDFINQIFNFLTIPLGVVVRLLGENSSSGRVDQLYTSIKNPDLQTYLTSDNKDKLLYPELAPYFSCQYPLLPLPITNIWHLRIDDDGISDKYYVMDPKVAYGHPSNFSGGFVIWPAAFIVSDDLVVKPVSDIFSVGFLDQMIMQEEDTEEKVVSFGIDQAYKLLKSSLVSESALTWALKDDLLKTPKKEN